MGEKLYKKINEYSPTAYVCHKIICNDQDEYRDFEFIEMNKAFEKIIGLDAKLVLGRKISDLHRKNLKNKLFWIDFYTELSKSIKNQEFKCYFDFLDKHFRINTHYVERNSFIIYFTDITNEIKQNEKINILSDNIETQIFYLLDAETYGPVNKAHAEFLGFSKEDFRCKNIDNFYDEKQVKICIKGNEKVFKEKKQIITEEWIVNAKNKRRLLKVVKTPKFDPKGEVEFVTCTAEDITEKNLWKFKNKEKKKFFSPWWILQRNC